MTVRTIIVIRAYQLLPKDIFIKQGVEYRVCRKDAYKIYYSGRTGDGSGRFIGGRSQEMIELILGKHERVHTYVCPDWATLN